MPLQLSCTALLNAVQMLLRRQGPCLLLTLGAPVDPVNLMQNPEATREVRPLKHSVQQKRRLTACPLSSTFKSLACFQTCLKSRASSSFTCLPTFVHLAFVSCSLCPPDFPFLDLQYVFDGNAPPSGYEPDDKTHPLNLYGETKLDGEKEVINGINSGAKGTLLRVPVLYGDAVSNDESAVNVRCLPNRYRMPV